VLPRARSVVWIDPLQGGDEAPQLDGRMAWIGDALDGRVLTI